MFQERFPGKTLSRSRLQRIYKSLKIKRKKIKLTKSMNYNARKRLRNNINEARDELSYYKNKGFRIIYCDETMITRNTV